MLKTMEMLQAFVKDFSQLHYLIMDFVRNIDFVWYSQLMEYSYVYGIKIKKYFNLGRILL